MSSKMTIKTHSCGYIEVPSPEHEFWWGEFTSLSVSVPNSGVLGDIFTYPHEVCWYYLLLISPACLSYFFPRQVGLAKLSVSLGVSLGLSQRGLCFEFLHQILPWLPSMIIWDLGVPAKITLSFPSCFQWECCIRRKPGRSPIYLCVWFSNWDSRNGRKCVLFTASLGQTSQMRLAATWWPGALLAMCAQTCVSYHCHHWPEAKQLDPHQNMSQLQLTQLLKIAWLSLKRGAMVIYILEDILLSPRGSLTVYERAALSSTALVYLKYNTL